MNIVPSDQMSRKVTFIVASDRLTSDRLTDAIGIAGDSTTSRPDLDPPQATWEVREAGTGTSDLTAMIHSVLDRVRPVKARLESMCAEESSACILRIVQYVSDDPVGPGFAIEAEDVALLANLNAVIDVDQYWASG